MPKTVIEQFPKQVREARNDGSGVLHISEMFCDTLQGEGVHSGVPASFIRLQGCTLQCVWCDTLEVWKVGNPYSIEEVLDLLEESDMIDKFKEGQHIVLTGGSPLKQESALVEFCRRFQSRFEFIPHFEIENEGVLLPQTNLPAFISTWNNSPKLANSGMKSRARYKPEVLEYIGSFPNSWFKFVVSCEEDWDEIFQFFIGPGIVRRDRVILMPEGTTQIELNKNREVVVGMVVKHNVRFCDRLHVTIWNKKTGV